MRANEFEIEVEVDIFALRAALAETAAAITGLKQQLRRTWTRPMAAEQRELWALKDKATLLCILRAFLRGRRHFSPAAAGSVAGQKWARWRIIGRRPSTPPRFGLARRRRAS